MYFLSYSQKPEKVGGAVCKGGPTLLGRPAGFSIKKALGKSEIIYIKITIRRTPIIFFLIKENHFPNLMIYLNFFLLVQFY